MLRLLAVAVLSLASLSAQAQIAHANFDTLVYANGTSMGGPNLMLAMRTQVPTGFTATRVEVFTGEGTGANTVALWSHDATNNQPLAPLGSGSWQMSFTNTWQGAPLTTPVALTSSQDIWVVWSCQNGSQASTQGNGAGGASYRGSTNGGVSWTGPFSGTQWKFRIWSGPAGHYEVFGAGCQGGAGIPRLSWFGLPRTGSSFNVQLDSALPSTVALLTVGDSNTTANGLPLPLSLAALGAPNCSLLTSFPVTLTAGVDVTGQSVITLSIPANPSVVGFQLFNQWFCLDLAANAFGFTASNGGAAVVGG